MVLHTLNGLANLAAKGKRVSGAGGEGVPGGVGNLTQKPSSKSGEGTIGKLIRRI